MTRRYQLDSVLTHELAPVKRREELRQRDAQRLREPPYGLDANVPLDTADAVPVEIRARGQLFGS